MEMASGDEALEHFTGDPPPADELQHPDVHMLLKTVMLGVIGAVSVIGNVMALVILILQRRLRRTPIYIVIGGLALADIVVTVMFVPEKIINHLQKGEVTSDTWCQIYGFLYNSCQYVAAFHLVGLAVFRAILLNDRSHQNPTMIMAIIITVVVWVTALLANIPVISKSLLDKISNRCVISFQNRDVSNDEVLSQVNDNDNNSEEEVYTLLSTSFSYFLPLVTIVIIYILTGYMSKRYFEDSYSPRERRLSKMINYLIMCFMFCRLPFEMVRILLFYQMKNTDFLRIITEDAYKFDVWLHVNEYLEILSMLDQAFRPIIYATMSREFGKMYDQIINCTYCKDDEEDDVLPARLRRRGQEIEEVLHTPLRQPIEIEDCSQEPEEII